jgi:hypothetical protein
VADKTGARAFKIVVLTTSAKKRNSHPSMVAAAFCALIYINQPSYPILIELSNLGLNLDPKLGDWCEGT